MDPFQLTRDGARMVWRFQFRLPEALFWLALLLSATGLVVESNEAALVFAVPFGLALAGVLRWHWHRRHSRHGLVIARFSALRGSEGRAEQVQELVLTSLQDKLPPEELALVHAVPAVVGTHARDFAIRLRRRLRARFLLHGRLDERGGSYAVFARTVQPVDRGVTHVDWHTRDVTPARARWAALIELLTPGLSVEVEEYPLEFTTELEAIVRGTAGQVAADFRDWKRAEDHLRAAISVAPASASHQVDRLRADLAGALMAQGRRDEALTVLRARASGENPSPYLLRRLFEVLGPQRGDIRYEWDPNERDEAIAALRHGAENEADPQRDLTLYNLSQLLGGAPESDAEAQRISEDLMRHSRYYRGTWYLKREVGATHYHRGEEAAAARRHDVARREYRVAARWYSRALRARPHLRLFEVEGPQVRIYHRYRQSATLLANAWDAHRKAGHRLRAWWYGRRTRREQRYLDQQGLKYFERSDWQAAEAYFDWATVGYLDEVEAGSWLHKAVCLKQLGHDTEADAAWSKALASYPLVLLARAMMVAPGAAPQLPRGVPGAEPTDTQTVIQMLEKEGVLVPPDDEGDQSG